MKQIHLVMPFTRKENKDILIAAYRSMNIILHPIMFQDEVIDFDESRWWWIEPLVIPMNSTSDLGNLYPQDFKRNYFIEHYEIIDNDYYVAADDDDMYEHGVFDAIKQMDDDIVIISMKRGDNIPEGIKQERKYITNTLYAHPKNIQIGTISNQQSFVKGAQFRRFLYESGQGNCADGYLAIKRKEAGIQTAYRSDLFVLFNYLEAGRWERNIRRDSMKISNVKLAIGIPCSFPMVPVQFFDAFAFMEKPDYVLIRKNNGPVDTLRNDIVRKALSIEATKLIMLDTDMIYHPKTIPSLLIRNLPILGALCFRRYPPFDSIMLRITDTGYESINDWNEGDLIDVDATGAGCIMYDMEVFKAMDRRAEKEIAEFEKLRPSESDMALMPKSTRDYILGLQERCVHPRQPGVYFKFRKDPHTGLSIGEDIGFCQELKAAGYKIFVDTSVPSDHLTTMAVNREVNKLYEELQLRQFAARDRAFGKQREVNN
jgi:hypothetical protein